MPTIRNANMQDSPETSKHYIIDDDLSLRAKGLLSVLLTLPDGYRFDIEDVTSVTQDSVYAIRAAIRELEEKRYVSRTQGRNELGQMIPMEYTVRPAATDFPHETRATALETDKPGAYGNETYRQKTNRLYESLGKHLEKQGKAEELHDSIATYLLNVNITIEGILSKLLKTHLAYTETDIEGDAE